VGEIAPWRRAGISTLGLSELLLILLVLIPCFVVLPLVACALLFDAFRQGPTPSRRLDPGLVWLPLIPCFCVVWNFVLCRRLSASLKAHFDSVGRTDVGDCGAGVGLAFSICVACSIIPIVGVLTALASIVLLIVYLVKVYGLSTQIAAI
jgi:hypothetical protein